MIPAHWCATRALGDVLRRQPFSDAKVRFAWTASVGAALARATSVRLRADGTLDVRASSDHWRLETIRSEPLVRKRLAELIGGDVVKAIVVTCEGASYHA